MLPEKNEKNRIIIVCSGASAKGFVPPDGALVIAVNNTINWLSRCDYWFTLDPENYNLDVINGQKNPAVKYVVAFDRPFDGVINLKRIRNTTLDGVHGKRGTLNGHKTLSEDRGAIHTGNSGYGALGLAYHLGFEKCVIVGLDADRSTCDGHDHGDLSHLPILFDSTIPQVGDRVVLASPNSLIESFKKMTREDAIAWLLS
jgi:hypothetical protein